MSTVAPAATRSLLAPDARLAAKARTGSPRELADVAAQTLVTEGLVKPVVASLREGGFAADAFKPGAAERRFRPMFDAILSDRVVEGSNFDLVDRVADRFERSISARNPGERSAAGAATPAPGGIRR